MASPISNENEEFDTVGYHEETESPEVEAQEEAVADPMEEFNAEMNSVAAEIESKFTARKSKRTVKENQWLEAQRMYLGSSAVTGYNSPDRPLSNPQDSGREMEFNVVATRCDTAVSVLWSKQFAGGDQNWELRPSDKPATDQGEPIPYPVAAAACERMEYTIGDQLARSRWGYQVRLGVTDMVVKGTMIIKSPVTSGETSTKYEKLSTIGEPAYAPKVAQKDFPCAKRVDPWFWFPDETATHITQVVDTIELHPMSLPQLEKLKLDPSFIKDNIDEAIKAQPTDDNADTYYGFTQLTDSGSDALKGKYKVLEYHGPLTADRLGKLQIEPAYDSPTGSYYAEIWVVNGRVIRLELSNLEGAQRVPYAVSVWKEDPSSIFGIGLATILRDPQRVINITYRMILDNSAISAGSQVVLDKTKITPADGKWELKPFKIWYNNEYDSDVTKSFFEFQPKNETGQMMQLLGMIREFAQEEAAAPFFMPGTQSAITQNTAHGTAQVLDQSTTIVDMHNERIDDDIVAPVITGFYAWNMQYNPDPTIKGDFEVDVSSSSDQRSAQVYLSELEKMAVLASQDPDMGIVIDKRELTKARLRAMKLRDKGIVKTDEQIAADEEERAKNQGPDPEMLKLEIEKQLAAVKEREIALKERSQQFVEQTQMQQMQWDHEEKMAAQYARLREAEAQVINAQSEERVAMLKLAASSEQHRDKIMADLQKTDTIESTKKFLGGIQATADFKKLALQEAEVEFAKKHGKGY